MQVAGQREGKVTRRSLGRGHSTPAMAGWRFSISAACVILLGTALIRAQNNQLPSPPLPDNPTPLAELLTAQEKKLLSESRTPRRLLEIYLNISDARLTAAFTAIKSDDNRTSEHELDVFNKVLADAARLAFSQQKSERRALTKRLEQRLLQQIKKLELIGKLFPIERVAFVEAALKQAKQLRVQALNETFASGEILRDTTEQEGKPNNDPPEMSGGQRINRLVKSSLLVPGGYKASPQIPGDYLTEEEDDHVREAQKPDERMKVFMKIADRRLMGITGQPPTGSDKKSQKKAEDEEREWGAIPKLERWELLRHYARAIEEAMTKLDDAYERNPKSSAIPRALTILGEATDRHLQILRSLQSEVRNEREERALGEALSQAERANEGAKKGPKSK